MSLLCSGVLETPCLAVRVMIYSNGEYIPVIKCIGYKQNHGADPDLLPPQHIRVLTVVQLTLCDTVYRYAYGCMYYFTALLLYDSHY